MTKKEAIIIDLDGAMKKSKRKCKRLSSEVIKQICEYNKQKATNRQIAINLGLNHKTVAYYLKKNGLTSVWCNQPINKIDESNAKCSRCLEIKPITEFQYGRKGQKYEYKFSYCNVCRKKQVYLNLNRDILTFMRDKYTRLLSLAKRNNTLCNITRDEFIEIYTNQNGKCFYTDVELICLVGAGKSRNSCSVDKIVPEKGYTKDNVVFCTVKVNTAKNDFSLDEIKLWMPEWYKRIVKHSKLHCADGDF
jgi:hypothetical protein